MKRILSFENIHIHIDLIAGLPLENIKSFEKGFNEVYSLSPDVLQLGFLKVLNGTQIKAEAEKYGILYSSYPPYQIIKTNCLSTEDIIKLKYAEDGLEELSNKKFFKKSLKYLFENNDIKPFSLFYKFGIILKNSPPLSNPKLYSTFYNFYLENNLKNEKEFLNLLIEDFKLKNPNKPLFKYK